MHGIVYGVDSASGANELVSALLEDPFASDEQKQALRTRWESQPEGSRRITLRCVFQFAGYATFSL